jgi:GNAT superfamily N-acetyltransferase
MDSKLILRPAQPGDRPAMERICAQAFERDDYVPEVWNDWLVDDQGLVLIGEIGGSVVALGKVTFQTPGQVWLEGMRVDPDFRRLGIAGRFLDHSIRYARRRGARVVRLGTSQRNTAVHRIVARAGMDRVGYYVLWKATSLLGGPLPRVLAVEQAGQVSSFLERSPVLAQAHGLYSVDWAWQELSAARVARFLAQGQALACLAPDGGLIALALVEPDPEEDWCWIGFVDGQPQAVGELATAIRAHVGQKGAEGVSVMLPRVPALRDAFQAAGYGFGDWEGELCIFESGPLQSRDRGNHDG